MTAPLISREAIDEGHVQHNDVFGIWALEHRGRLLDAARMAQDLIVVAQALRPFAVLAEEMDGVGGMYRDTHIPCSMRVDELQRTATVLATFRARWPGVLER